ncbi:MAG: acetylxylan esterase [Acidobacteria bacterium]|nr:acetylxylan esterase [Acidobacteriota bacterium]
MITRRRLALAAAAPALKMKAQTQPRYQGSLEKFSSQIQAAQFDSLAWTRARYAEMPRQLRFNATTRKQAEAWQKKLRAKVTELVGGFPARTPLKPQILEKADFPTYTREAVIFESRPGLAVFGYLLTPKAQKQRPMPVVISVPGHGRGADDIVGIDDKGQPRTEKTSYQYDYAIQIVEHGMAAFAIEPLGFGCRRDEAARKRGLGTSSCQPAAGAALLFGETMIGWRVYDIMRTVDYLETRSEFDPKRIGLMGISGGGTCTIFGAALETRIAAAFASGYLNTFKDSILSLSHCIDNYVPGILQWCEQYDVASLIAPRPLFCESGEKDNIFPVEAFKFAHGEVKKVYQVMGVPELTGSEIHPGQHVFHGKQGLPFLARHLKA